MNSGMSSWILNLGMEWEAQIPKKWLSQTLIQKLPLETLFFIYNTPKWFWFYTKL